MIKKMTCFVGCWGFSIEVKTFCRCVTAQAALRRLMINRKNQSPANYN